MTEIDSGSGSIVVALRAFVASSKRSAPPRRPRARAQQPGRTVGLAIDERPDPARVVDRRRPTPATPTGYLEELPARVLLDRLTMPVLAVGLDGVVAYTNPACATLLGHPEAAALTGRPLNTLLVGQSHTAPSDCVAMLKSLKTGTVTIWRDADGCPVSTVVSQSLLRRDDDPVLLVSVTDISESLWRDETAVRELRLIR